MCFWIWIFLAQQEQQNLQEKIQKLNAELSDAQNMCEQQKRDGATKSQQHNNNIVSLNNNIAYLQTCLDDAM